MPAHASNGQPGAGADSAEQGGAAPTPRRKDLSKVIQFYSPPSDGSAVAEGKVGQQQPLGIPTGTVVNAELLQGIVLSGNSARAPARAVLVAPLRFDDGGEVLPRGTVLVGTAESRLQGEQGRVLIELTTVVLPDRRERGISAIAIMRDGTVGLPARVDAPDNRVLADLGEGFVDVVEGVLSRLPGGGSGRRFAADARDDARQLREVSVKVSVPKGAAFMVQFLRSA